MHAGYGPYKRRTDLIQRARRAIDVLAAGGTNDEAAQAAGVSRRTLERWLNVPEILQEIRDTAHRRILRGSLPDVYKALLAKAREGDTSAIRILLTHADGYTERQRQDVTMAPVQVVFSQDEIGPADVAQGDDRDGDADPGV